MPLLARIKKEKPLRLVRETQRRDQGMRSEMIVSDRGGGHGRLDAPVGARGRRGRHGGHEGRAPHGRLQAMDGGGETMSRAEEMFYALLIIALFIGIPVLTSYLTGGM